VEREDEGIAEIVETFHDEFNEIIDESREAVSFQDLSY